MKSKALYFPYINAPNSAWMNQMLIYWDQVSSIVPSDFLHEPDRLTPRMRELVGRDLVTQLFPAEYVHGAVDFGGAFARHLESLSDMAMRRQRFESGETTSIHLEKLGSIGNVLVDLRLASLGNYPWFDVEEETATEFMAYLATVLGQFDDVDAMPMTDSQSSLETLLRAGVSPNVLEQQLQATRLRVLDRVFPTPLGEIPVDALADFKERHRDLLPDFRRVVERELVALASIESEELRERRLEIFFDEAEQRIHEISARMKENGWQTKLARLAGLVLTEAVPVLGLLKAARDALANGTPVAQDASFAYAAHLAKLADPYEPGEGVA